MTDSLETRIQTLEAGFAALMERVPDLEKQFAALGGAAVAIGAGGGNIFSIAGQAIPIEQAVAGIANDVAAIIGEIGTVKGQTSPTVAVQAAPAAPPSVASNTVPAA